MQMNMLGWSSEAGNPNIQDLKENCQKQREKPQVGVYKALKLELKEQLSKLSNNLTLNVEIPECAFVKIK